LRKLTFWRQALDKNRCWPVLLPAAVERPGALNVAGWPQALWLRISACCPAVSVARVTP
jgi:hypothetical protein